MSKPLPPVPPEFREAHSRLAAAIAGTLKTHAIGLSDDALATDNEYADAMLHNSSIVTKNLHDAMMVAGDPDEAQNPLANVHMLMLATSGVLLRVLRAIVRDLEVDAKQLADVLNREFNRIIDRGGLRVERIDIGNRGDGWLPHMEIQV